MSTHRPETADLSPAALPEGAVLIHGGLHKTGSTALQNTLAFNRELLPQRGWCYPLNGLVAQPQIGFRHLTLMMEILQRGACPAWARLREEIAGARGRVLLSHENFYSPQVDPQRVAAQLPGREIHLLVYLRHPADYIESCYREWVRRLGFAGSIEQFYAVRRPWLDVQRLVGAWEAAIGAGRVHLRPYAREHFVGGSVLNDFLHLTGIGAEGLLPADGNDSLNTRQALVHLIANLHKLPKPSVEAVNDLLGGEQRAAEALAGVPDDGAAIGLEPAKVMPLRHVLQGVRDRVRVMGDALFAEIEQRHLPDFENALQARGAPAGSLSRSAYAALPQDPSFEDAALRASVAALLA